MPMYRTKFLHANQWEVVHKGYTHLATGGSITQSSGKQTNKLGFDLYLVDIYGLLDREKVYGYTDDAERFTAFQWRSRLMWPGSTDDIVHVHDHHTALIPSCFKYVNASSPWLEFDGLTIHNAQYQGWMDGTKPYIPAYDTWKAVNLSASSVYPYTFSLSSSP